MKNIYALCSVLLFSFANAQDPAIQWQKTIGGSAADLLNSVEITSDGGYILGGYSPSNLSGDKTENSNGNIDLWIVKTNSTGDIEWQNTIGGSGDDFLNVIKPTADGGYIVLAGSDSNISGDKTENSRGGLDFWILKLNAAGAIVWQKTYGGANPDFDTFGQQTADGGYIVGGYSDSGISGDKTEASNGQRDYWILKLDSMGNITWQNGIGGSLIDRVQAVAQTSDLGYIIGGFSTSGISGDKTEVSQGGTDYWIVKLTAAGTLSWQNTIGGSGADALRDLIPTSDGGYLVGGYSVSNISGDKTENSNGDNDYWIVKLDASGSIVWQNTIGGANTEFLRDIKQMADTGYLIAGYSNSNVSGDKLEVSNGGYDFWLLRLNASGGLVSQNSIGGSGDESGGYIIPVSDGGFMMACSSDSSISGDKSNNSKGAEDYWIFKVSANILAADSFENAGNVLVYPNPSTGNFTFSLGRHFEQVSLSVVDISGKTIYRKSYQNTDLVNLDLNAQAGTYFVKIETGGTKKTLKIIKN